ncbi:MAG TPA: hypothetical protein VE988_16595 [Gemmataceae bacterium]|nr:hypothetical protein [Gemmataceae bacterium]
MPATAKVEARQQSVMAAPENAEDETRVVVDAGHERLVLVATELYALAGDDLEQAVRADLVNTWGKDPATMKFEKLEVAPLRAVAVTPPAGDGKQEANLALGVYVGNTDGTVQFLAFYVNPAAAKDMAAVQSLARKIAATVDAGSKSLFVAAGPRTFPGIGGEQLGLTVPAGFTASLQDGPDFAVCHVLKLAPLGQAPARCGIYVGGHPAFLFRKTNDPLQKVDDLKGKLFGENVDWKVWSKDGLFTCEVIMPYPNGKTGAIHVFCSAGSQEQMAAMRAVAESLRVEAVKK